MQQMHTSPSYKVSYFVILSPGHLITEVSHHLFSYSDRKCSDLNVCAKSVTAFVFFLFSFSVSIYVCMKHPGYRLG